MMKSVATLGVLAALGGSTASAGQIVQNLNIATQTLDYVTSLTFNQFDPSFGTLDDIEFVTTGTTDDSVVLTNQAGRTRAFTISTSVDLLIENSSATLLFDEAIPTGTETVYLGAGQTETVTGSATGAATAIYAAPSGLLLTYTGTAATGNPSSPIDITGFVGLGSLNLLFDASNNTVVSGGSNTAVTSGTASGSLAVIYDYTNNVVTTVSSAPEPSTALLFGTTLLAVGALRNARGNRKR